MDNLPPMPEPPMMDGGMEAQGSEFDTNFDAGVDTDENDDPKKFIQQLTGKLSQSLRKYNQNLPKPDQDLCKYVAGMILKQTTDGLTGDEKQEIIDKVNGDGEGQGDEMPMDNGGQQPMMEGRNHRQRVNELFQELTRKSDDSQGNGIQPRKIDSIGFRKKPFTAPSIH